jgi:hypothetical protein
VIKSSYLIRLGRNPEAVDLAKPIKESPDLRSLYGQISETQGKKWSPTSREDTGNLMRLFLLRGRLNTGRFKGEAAPYAEKGRFLFEVRCILREWLPFGKKVSAVSEIDLGRSIGYPRINPGRAVSNLTSASKRRSSRRFRTRRGMMSSSCRRSGSKTPSHTASSTLKPARLTGGRTNLHRSPHRRTESGRPGSNSHVPKRRLRLLLPAPRRLA